MCIYRVYLKRLGKLQEWVSHIKTWKKVHADVCRKHSFLELRSPRSPELVPFYFYLWGHIKTIAYPAPIEIEETLHQRISDASTTIRERLGTFEIAQLSVIRCIHACTESLRGHFEHMSWPGTSSTIKSNKNNLETSAVNCIRSCVISGFRRNLDEICTLLGYYLAYTCDSVPTFRSHFQGSCRSLTLEDGTDRLPRNVGMEVPLLAA